MSVSSTSDLLRTIKGVVEPAWSWQCEDRALTPTSLRRKKERGGEAVVRVLAMRQTSRPVAVCPSFHGKNGGVRDSICYIKGSWGRLGARFIRLRAALGSYMLAADPRSYICGITRARKVAFFFVFYLKCNCEVREFSSPSYVQ